MRHWTRSALYAFVFVGGASIATPALAKPKTPAELTQKPAKPPVARKIIKKTIVPSNRTPGQPGVKVFLDPDTGQIRAATHEEAQTLDRASNRVSIDTPAPAPLQQVRYFDGSVAVQLNDDFQNEVIVERRPDGTLQTRCVPHDQAGRAVETPSTNTELETE